jgi:glycosyltransferase involved in cell wall biosynthesis
MGVCFIYAGRRGSNLECAIALHAIAKKSGFASRLVLSSDNERLGAVLALYPEAEVCNFFSLADILALRKSLNGETAFFTMLSPKIVPLFLSLSSPKIFYFHSTYDYSQTKKTTQDAYHEFLHATLIKNSTKTVATMPELALQIKRELGVDAEALPHPPYSPIKPSFFPADDAIPLPFRKGDYFLNFGEISRPSKGTDFLLGAVRGTNLRVVLAGKKASVGRLPNVFHLDRWVSDGQLRFLVKNCRCVALPYLLRSQFSGCLALAYHYKKPVLAPNSEAFAGLVDEGKTGWLFKHGDEGDLRARMLEIASGKAKFSARAIDEKERRMEKATAQKLAEILKRIG